MLPPAVQHLVACSFSVSRLHLYIPQFQSTINYHSNYIHFPRPTSTPWQEMQKVKTRFTCGTEFTWLRVEIFSWKKRNCQLGREKNTRVCGGTRWWLCVVGGGCVWWVAIGGTRCGGGGVKNYNLSFSNVSLFFLLLCTYASSTHPFSPSSRWRDTATKIRPCMGRSPLNGK